MMALDDIIALEVHSEVIDVKSDNWRRETRDSRGRWTAGSNEHFFSQFSSRILQDKMKLTTDERESMLAVGRSASSLDDAKDAMFSWLLEQPFFSEMDEETLSSYAWSAAKFTHAKEWKERGGY